ncbi:hypothetical protein IFM89_030574 [Coptis chinensis]|uniref:Uncharacterized protein n=1 Tax=Coptis chinensis TaxID=261450 RepID=A0A835HN47_9MAGN|nr:hypothetical protein IFM89_030574 [Coptis chinensis]
MDNLWIEAASTTAVQSFGNNDIPWRLRSRYLNGKKMPRRKGGKQITVKNVWDYKIDPGRNLMWVSGQVPGAEGNCVFIKDTVYEKPDHSVLFQPIGQMVGVRPQLGGPGSRTARYWKPF